MKTKGFTLLELLITMALLVCLSSLSIASYSWLLRTNEQQTIIDELRTAVQYAKIQAISLGAPVFLVSFDSSLNWSNGLRLNTFNKKANKLELLYQWQWHHPRWKLKWDGIKEDRVIFSDNPMNAMSNGHFILENRDTHQQTIIILNRLGRIRVSNSL